PLRLQLGASPLGALGTISELTGRRILQLQGALTAQNLGPALTLCWFDGVDLFVRLSGSKLPFKLAEAIAPHAAMPVAVFVETADRGSLDGIAESLICASIELPALSY